MIINHNMASLNTYRQLSTNNTNTGKSLEKLSSGLRINKAGDDAAGLAISEKMRGQIRGLDQASRNAQDGISLINTAEGSLSETHSILQRMRELATQASSDTNVTVDREEIQKEVNQLTSEVNRIGNTTEFNTMKLLNGDRANTFQVTGTQLAGGAASTANAATGVTVKLDGTSVAGGAHTVTVTKTADALVNPANITPVASQATVTGHTATLAGDSITADATAIADDWTLTKTASGYQLTNAGGTVQDDIAADSSGKYVYNDHGLNFTIDSTTQTTGDKIDFTTAGGAETLNTSQTGYAAANTGGNDAVFDASGDAAAGEIGFTTDVQTDTWEIEYDGTDFTVKNGSGTVSDKVAIGDDYASHGLNFNISSKGTMATGDKITFSTTAPTQTYTYKASLDGGTAQTITTGASGSTAVAGLKLDTAGTVNAGTFSFNVEAATTGTDKSLNFQIGANQGQFMNVDINDMRSEALKISSSAVTGNASSATGVAGAAFVSTKTVTNGTNSAGAEYALDVSDSTKATAAIKVLDNAIKTVSSERSKLGANTNRLEHTITNLGTSSENLTAAESRIRDVDMAKEMMNFQKNNILQQAAQAMLAQANQQPQGVLQLLR